MGVERATAAVNGEIAKLLIGRDAADQAGLDAALAEADGTPNLARLGGNATVAVSLAALHATAAAEGCRCGRTSPKAGRSACRCPRFRFSAAGPTQAGAPTFRTS